MLIDAGIAPRTAAKRLDGTGVSLRDVAAICVTHADCDHFRPAWVEFIREKDVRVFCHEGHRDELGAACGGSVEGQLEAFAADPFEPLPGVSVTPVALDHDSKGSHGFVIEGFGCRIGYATDLGRVPQFLVEGFSRLDVLALESNYDAQMQLDSTRPWSLKQRIMGGRGHLSNDQAFAAIRQILDRHQDGGVRLPAHIVLLHRSRFCNCPKLVRQMFSRDARIAPRLTLAEQFQRSAWLRVRPATPLVGEQLTMQWA